MNPIAAGRGVLVCLFILFCGTAVATVTAPEDSLSTVRPAEVLVLGPLPAIPDPLDEVFPRGHTVPVPEIPPCDVLPREGQQISLVPGHALSWRLREVADGSALPEEASRWQAVVMRLARRAEVTLRLAGADLLFVAGRPWDLETGEDGVPASTRTLPAGVYVIQARSAGDGRLEGKAPAGVLSFSLDEQIPVTRFEQLAGLTRTASLAISDDGKVLARRLSRRQPELGRLDLLAADGRVLAADLGGPQARPLAFQPGSRNLLLRRAGDEGTDLLLWTGSGGAMRTLLRDEPGLGLVRFSPDGRFLLFSSGRAFEEDEVPDGPRRYAHLRERVADFTPVPHLHLLEVATGARRVLTLPGDRVLDDAVFGPEGRSVYYAQTRHQVPRPWFHSELRRLDLATGQDQELARFTGGWEVRPQGLSLTPDGGTLIFLGPPEEVGGGRKEHNVYNKQIWSLDLAGGQFQRRTRGQAFAFESGGGLPLCDAEGRLLVKAVRAGRTLLTRVDPARDWSVEVLPTAGDDLGALAVSPNGRCLLYTASTFDQPSRLYQARAGRKGKLVEDAHAREHFLWGGAQDASFRNAEGTKIDAWFYPPLVSTAEGAMRYGAPDTGKVPLVVYYYAGSTPTLRGFNGTHQFFAANGYGVLVVNPRGAYGFGDAYADFHAGDWGPVAAADIIAATEAILARHRWLDADGIGIYGGSYGGFMTEYLVTATDIFAAAVSMYGISDLATYWGQGTWGWTYGDMALGGRFPWSDSQYFIAHSPLFRADRIHTPLLLLHGQDDANVTPGESDQLFTALSVLDRPVELVLFPGEDHGIAGDWENLVAHRQMILEWFDRYCRHRPEAWEERWGE
ncbi:hypothetical protein CSA17_03155 [bacterium DOLJORAL78_65_58]|nr:MAG: hypothetical protein CSB20_03450 [bacterium DOLZORAL124_64_63]PIE76262.1 MAG: hypothetical protein CSA17_03155 [bacterium DOLJORAL78_65_58]